MGAGRGRRTGIILILLIIVVLVVAIGALAMMPGLIPGLGDPGAEGTADVTAGPPTATPEPPTIDVIVAARDIPRGARLSVQDVTIIKWPEMEDAPPPTGYLFVSREEGGPGLEQVEGRIARTDIITGQPVLDFMLTPGTEPTGLVSTGSDAALLIPPNQVAMAIPATRFGLVAYALREGDHVDLLMSLSFVEVDLEWQTILPNYGVLVTDNVELAQTGLQGVSFPLWEARTGPVRHTQLVIPNPTDLVQRSRQSTQLMIDNVTVLRVGNWSLTGLNEPIVVTAAAPTTADGDAAATGEAPATDDEGAPPPTATPVQIPDVITLAMSRQDALVLKFMMENGAFVDLVLRSALDNDVNDVVTENVTLSYIIEFYNLEVPPRLPYAVQPRRECLPLAFHLSTACGIGGGGLPIAPDATTEP